MRADLRPADSGTRGRRPGPVARVSSHVTWILLLSVGTEAFLGRFGFHPSDQGFILAQANRLRHGEIPHLDVISARPLGSAVLHLADFVLPGPLFFTSGALSMLEIVLATVALAVLVTRRPLLTWGPGLTLVVAGASLVNLNSFPLMAWHTIDGIALTACGAWALDAGLRSGRAFPRRGGLFLFGVAAFVKQSFVLAVLVAALWLVLHPSTRTWRRAVADLLCLGAFPLAYVGVVTAYGGFGAMTAQVTGGAPAYGERLLLLDGLDSVPRKLAVFTAVVVALVAIRLLTERIGPLGAHADRLLVLAAAALVGWTVVDGDFVAADRWADHLWWMLVLAALANAMVTRRIPWGALFVLALGYLVSLSWGQDTPTLVAGSLALSTILLLVQGTPPMVIALCADRRPAWFAISAVVGLAAALLSGSFVLRQHDRAPYLDQPKDRLTEDLGRVTPAMAGIRTNPETFRYVEQIGACLREYPASRVAILPDNPFAYAAFDLTNPFPLEWPLPLEIVGDARQRMIATAAALDREGSYLVLFETLTPAAVAAGGPVPVSVSPETPIHDYLGLEHEIRGTLTGRTVTCGSFVGKWAH